MRMLLKPPLPPRDAEKRESEGVVRGGDGGRAAQRYPLYFTTTTIHPSGSKTLVNGLQRGGALAYMSLCLWNCVIWGNVNYKCFAIQQLMAADNSHKHLNLLMHTHTIMHNKLI